MGTKQKVRKGEEAVLVPPKQPEDKAKPKKAPIQVIQGGANANDRLQETDRRTIHRYYLLLEALGINPEELKGSSPDEAQMVFQGVKREMQEARTEMQILLQSGQRVMLGEKEYEIPPLTFRGSEKFRERCGVFAKHLLDFVVSRSVAPGTKSENGGVRYPLLEQWTQQSGIDVHRLLEEGMPYVMGKGFEEILDLLFMCSEELTKDRELILDTATLVQPSHASLEVFRSALPFVVNMFRGMWTSYENAKAAGLPGIR